MSRFVARKFRTKRFHGAHEQNDIGEQRYDLAIHPKCLPWRLPKHIYRNHMEHDAKEPRVPRTASQRPRNDSRYHNSIIRLATFMVRYRACVFGGQEMDSFRNDSRFRRLRRILRVCKVAQIHRSCHQSVVHVGRPPMAWRTVSHIGFDVHYAIYPWPFAKHESKCQLYWRQINRCFDWTTSYDRISFAPIWGSPALYIWVVRQSCGEFGAQIAASHTVQNVWLARVVG